LRSDGVSASIFMTELAAAYNAIKAGRAGPDLAALPIQYADFSAWQRARLDGGELEAQRAHWRQQLADAPLLLQLPTDFARPAEPSGRRRRRPGGVGRGDGGPARARGGLRGDDVHGAAGGLAGARAAPLPARPPRARSSGGPDGAPPPGRQVLLGRYSRSEDVVVGTPLANRSRPELEGLLGYFVNTVALRGDLSGAPRRHAPPQHACGWRPPAAGTANAAGP